MRAGVEPGDEDQGTPEATKNPRRNCGFGQGFRLTDDSVLLQGSSQSRVIAQCDISERDANANTNGRPVLHSAHTPY